MYSLWHWPNQLLSRMGILLNIWASKHWNVQTFTSPDILYSQQHRACAQCHRLHVYSLWLCLQHLNHDIHVGWDILVFEGGLKRRGVHSHTFKVSSKISYCSFFWFPSYVNKIYQSINQSIKLEGSQELPRDWLPFLVANIRTILSLKRPKTHLSEFSG